MQRQCTTTCGSGGAHVGLWDYAGASASITEGVRATNKLRRHKLLQTEALARKTRFGMSSGCAAAARGGER